MQLESLKMFCDVVETGSFSRAAQLNHVTQSAISQQIRALENRFEQKLLSRSLPSATVQHQVAEGTLVAKPFAEGTFSRPIGLLVRKGKYLSRAAQAVLEAFNAAATAEE